MSRLLLISLFSCAAFTRSASQDLEQPTPEQVQKQRVEAALERAKQYLVTWTTKAPPVQTGGDPSRCHELVLYALLHLGIPQTEKCITTLAGIVENAPIERTYQAALGAMALQALDRVKYRNRIAHFAQFLVDQQCANGQWGYGRPIEHKPDVTPVHPDPKSTTEVIVIKRLGKGPADGDNSCSQYAALGLRACVAAGLELPKETFQLAIDWWERSQKGDGSWAYSSKDAGPDREGYASMTAGGAASLVIYRSHLKKDWEKDPKIAKALEWLAANFAVTGNPKHKNPPLFSYYWLYALERVGDLMALEKIGTHAWYAEGADQLLKTQLRDGSWDSKNEMIVADTCFAVLFLRKATRPAPKVATGK